MWMKNCVDEKLCGGKGMKSKSFVTPLLRYVIIKVSHDFAHIKDTTNTRFVPDFLIL